MLTGKLTIPAEIIAASNEGRLVPFIGAGLSQLVGCPSWRDFSVACLDHFKHQGELSESDVSQLISGNNGLSPKMASSIARILEKESNHPIDFRHILTPTNLLNLDRIQRLITRLGPGIVTTNYDDVLTTLINSPKGMGLILSMIPAVRVIQPIKSFSTAQLANLKWRSG